MPSEKTDSTRRGPRSGDADVRAELLTAAARLVRERGLASIARRDIASAAGVTPAMVGYYFPGRNAIWEGLLEEGIGSVRAAFVAADGAAPRRRVEDLIRGAMRAAHARPYLPLLAIRSVWGAPKDRGDFAERAAPISFAILRSALDAGPFEGRPLRRDVPLELLVVIIASSVIFPILARPALERALGTSLDDAFVDSLASAVATLVTEDAPCEG